MKEYYQSLVFIGDRSYLEKFLNQNFSISMSNSVDILEINRKLSKKTLGISELSGIKEFALLKSYNRKDKVIIIQDGETLTTEAQNSLLKILEEPPQNTLIVIRCNVFPKFVNTIFSRCQIVDLTLGNNISGEEDEFKNFLNMEFYEKLIVINKLLKTSDTEEKQYKIENLLKVITENLLSDIERNIDNHDKILRLISLLDRIKDIKKKFKQNVNSRLLLDNLALIIR
jgi:DNA polymerase III delta prime subunit